MEDFGRGGKHYPENRFIINITPIFVVINIKTLFSCSEFQELKPKVNISVHSFKLAGSARIETKRYVLCVLATPSPNTHMLLFPSRQKAIYHTS